MAAYHDDLLIRIIAPDLFEGLQPVLRAVAQPHVEND